MKHLLKKLVPGVLAAITLLAAGPAQAQVTVTVDATKTWIGYMNVFGINADGTPNYGGYQFGASWGTKDLRAKFDPAGASFLTLTPCTNVWETTDTYWVAADGITPNKWMDASFYVQNDNLAGQTITFNGTCLTNSLVGAANSDAFIKVFAPDYSYNYNATASLVAGQAFSLQLTANPGTHVQYGFETQAADANPTNLPNLGSAVLAVSLPDPNLTEVASRTAVEGQTLQLSTTASGTAPFTYQWSQNGNSLTDGGEITGSASNVLTLAPVSLADAGTYTVTVYNELGQNSSIAQLNVIPLAQAITNLLVDPSFESDTWAASSTAGWVNFNGAVFQNVNDDYYDTATPISVLNGTNEVQVYPTGAGSYNGFYQDVPATPGTVYTASANFYTSSLDQISGGNLCFLELQFRDTYGNVLRDYRTSDLTASSPADTWINLAPTNVLAGDLVTSLGGSAVLLAPAGTVSLRAQVNYFAPANSGGSVYVDLLDLRLRAPAVTASLSGKNAQLTFPTIYGPTYQVLYKTNLTDAAWQTLTTVPGDGTVKTVSDPAGARHRFYIVNTQ